MTRGNVIVLKDSDWLKRQVFAGKVVSRIHREIFPMMVGKVEHLTTTAIGLLANDIIQKNNCTPTFLGYRGFSSVVCASVNKELVHGATRDVELQEGDVIKIDVVCTFEGAIADCAVTYVYGKAKNPNIIRMLASCQAALSEAIGVFKPGRRIGEIGNIIFQRSKTDGFGVITDFGGHGLDYNVLHAPPFVPNKSRAQEGLTIQPGMSIAIEPMFVLGKNTNTKLLKDKWTVLTNDIGCHYEHSVTLDEDGHQHIITEHGIQAKSFA